MVAFETTCPYSVVTTPRKLEEVSCATAVPANPIAMAAATAVRLKVVLNIVLFFPVLFWFYYK
jgi:hypothetical protein